MDIVYILGTGSTWQDNEIRYSLRSLRHLPHERVFVVGQRPSWLQNIEHVPAEDIYGPQKQKNALHKLSVAIDAGVSDDFVLMNDDFYILKPIGRIPTAYRRTLEEALSDAGASGNYRDAIINTHRRFPHGLDYSLHTPFVYNRHKLRETISACGDEPVLLRSMYGNQHQIGGEKEEDVKLHTRRDFIIAKIMGFGTFLSSSDETTRDPAFQQWLQDRFPDPSPYEL